MAKVQFSTNDIIAVFDQDPTEVSECIKEMLSKETYTFKWAEYFQILFNQPDNEAYNKEIKNILIGIELILIGAYVKDDILDDTKFRNEQQTFLASLGMGKASLYADMFFFKGQDLISEAVGQITKSFEVTNMANTLVRKGLYKSTGGQIISDVDDIEKTSIENCKNTIKLKTGELIAHLSMIPSVLFCPKNIQEYYSLGLLMGASSQYINDVFDFKKAYSEDFFTGKNNLVLAHLFKELNGNNTLLAYWNSKAPNNKANALLQIELNNSASITYAISVLIDSYKQLVDAVSLPIFAPVKVDLLSFLQQDLTQIITEDDDRKN